MLQGGLNKLIGHKLISDKVSQLLVRERNNQKYDINVIYFIIDAVMYNKYNTDNEIKQNALEYLKKRIDYIVPPGKVIGMLYNETISDDDMTTSFPVERIISSKSDRIISGKSTSTKSSTKKKSSTIKNSDNDDDDDDDDDRDDGDDDDDPEYVDEDDDDDDDDEDNDDDDEDINEDDEDDEDDKHSETNSDGDDDEKHIDMHKQFKQLVDISKIIFPSDVPINIYKRLIDLVSTRFNKSKSTEIHYIRRRLYVPVRNIITKELESSQKKYTSKYFDENISRPSEKHPFWKLFLFLRRVRKQNNRTFDEEDCSTMRVNDVRAAIRILQNK